MPFGLTDASKIFMDLMNYVCSPMLDKSVIVFIDDILIYSKSKKEHEVHLREVLETLQKERLYAKFVKCEFWLQEIQFLSHVINYEGIKVDPAKIEAVMNWKTPKDVGEIRIFLGRCVKFQYLFDRKEAKIWLSIVMHPTPVSDVSLCNEARDGRFTSNFLGDFQEEIGTRLHMSTAFHPQTDSQSERTIQTLEDMLRVCVIDFGGNWDDHLPLVEFAYNNSYYASIKMPPYEMPYGRKCRTPVCWDEVGSMELASTDVVLATTEKVKTIRERLREAQDRTNVAGLCGGSDGGIVGVVGYGGVGQKSREME
uniref:Putative reverse transcriptase domain-containing protein n=1 Tax=Tanacetum cinerariifolium TaxID=118510 RepID=A0A699GHN2_TANCI|nr:putative reverse transcriptase domain-containing protein [Tanacetum cinerariifolium]